MNKHVSLEKWSAGAIILVAFLVTIGLMLACAPQPKIVPKQLPPVPASQWGDTFTYRYDPPAKMEPASVRATIVVVNPIYKEEESALLDRTYKKVAKGFSASMGVDMDKIVIAKGMTVKGPYTSLDDITYSSKKGSDLTLVPKIFITTRINYDDKEEVKEYRNERGLEEKRVNRRFEMQIGGWIAFVMQEPLSGEKMWIKRLELEETTSSDIESYEAIPQYATYQGGCFGEVTHRYLTGYKRGELLYDGKVDAMAVALATVYPTIMKKCWTYIDAEEILSLKEKVKEIRMLKRY